MAFKHGYCTLFDEFGDGEIEVAEILAGFPGLIAVSKYGSWLPYTWGGKRRRSAEANLGPRRAVRSPPTSVSPSPSTILSGPVGPAITTTAAAAAAGAPETEGPITVKAEPATSPATPLSFSPSESDERPKRLKRKVSTKKRREDLLKIISQFTESNELLRREIQKVTQYYEQLKARNSLWKARNEELNMSVIKREDRLNLLQMNLGQATVKYPHVDDEAHLSLRMPGITVYEQQPFMTERKANNQEMGCSYQNPHGRIVSLFQSTTTSTSDDMGSRGIIPDLNLSIEQPFWMDFKVKQQVGDKSTVVNRAIVDNKAIAAQARRRRMLICKKKISNVSSKLRFPFR